MNVRDKRPLRRLLAAAVAALTALTLIDAVAFPAQAQASSPSVELPDTPEPPIETPTVKAPRPPDQATAMALHGDQPVSPNPPDGGGLPTATPLAPSSTWQVSAHTGDFTWGYPLRVPPAAGGLEPRLSLSYASSNVDGRTSATNNQASWVGDGWTLDAGFIERVYGGCSEDDMGGTTPPKTGDLCWRSNNAMSSKAGMLIAETGDLWRAKSDDGSRIELLRDPALGNGDNNGEYWKVTAVDGTQYFYGSRPASKSTWTVPVFGDDAGEPCHGATFETSRCTQAWRWNLDKVIDPHGNMMIYTYQVETNSYGANLKDTAVSYIRSGTLWKIEYGLRSDGGTLASGQVEFVVADRCVPGSTCTPSKKDNWPDVPWASKCDTATCADNHSPTFWSSKRLSKIITRVRGAAGFTDVDSWTLEHQFPDPGDDEKAALWLRSITHTGHAGGTKALPAMTFEGTAMPNRVLVSQGIGPLNRYRVTGIVSETGAVLTVVYAAPDCVDGQSMPTSPEHNTLRCYPVKWTPENGNERLDYFHKYVVASIVESDRYDGTSEKRTEYQYLDGAAWHYDMSEFTKDSRKTWSQFRGFGRVRVSTGSERDPAGPVGQTEFRYYRGMHDDRLPDSERRTVNVADSRGGSYQDSDWLAGVEFERTVFNGAGGPVVTTTITTPVVDGPNATRGENKSYLIRPGTAVTHTALAGGTWRTTRAQMSYDDRGILTEVDDSGDIDVTGDDKCTTKSYARNADRWIISLPYRVSVVGVRCDATAAMPDDLISDDRIGYDGLAIGTAPVKGDVTRTETASGWDGTSLVYAMTSEATFDAHGRMKTSKDALENVTTLAYAPVLGGPVTQLTATNALGHTATTTLAPEWGSPTVVVDANGRRTETEYDALGRVEAVWLPNRNRASNQTASATFTYEIRNDGPVVVTTSRINPLGNYTVTKEIYDALLRPRQVQAPASGGGRLLTDTRYDSQGRLFFTSRPYFNNSEVDGQLWVASEVDKLGATRTEYDGAGRVTATVFRGGGVEKWRTTYTYAGDRVHVTPPQGGTATTTISDAQGRTTEIRQYHAPAPAGDFDATRYTYTKAGKLASIVDAMGNTWRYTYDLRGRAIRIDDPDKGTGTMEYDNAGRVVAATDARGVRLAYDYDELGRRTGVTQGGMPLASWTYDTVRYGKGLPATATRHVGDADYTTSILGYNQLSQPLAVRVTIPEQEQTLAGSYTTYLRYDPDGGLASKGLPAIGNLPAEGIVHERDALGLPKVTRGGFSGQTIHYVSDSQYTRFGEIARLHLGEGTKRVWQSYYYDPHTGRLNRSIVDAEVPAPMQSDVRYTYDAAGNITSIADTPREGTADTQCFQYDYLRRLTQAWTPDSGCATDPQQATLGGPAPYRHAYTYDKAGNRLTETRFTGSTPVTSTYAYPAAQGSQPHAVTSVDTNGVVDQYGYDAAGNMTARPGQTLTWNSEGSVDKVTTAAGDTSFVYDPSGNRLIRRTPDKTTLYLDGQELTLNHDTGVLSATRYYTHGGRIIAVRASGHLSWLTTDHQGTADLAVDADTLTVSRRRQTPFGQARGITADLPGDKGFVGGTDDASTGLVHLGAREYDAALGRFISVDPIMGGEPQLLNAYSYSNNSPVTFNDPTGLYCDGCDYQRYQEQQQQQRVYYCDGCDYQRYQEERKNLHFCDSCEYYDHTRGEQSVWTPERKRKSFCDSCEYYSQRDGTRSAWNRKYYTPEMRPAVFAHSEAINIRIAYEKKVAAEEEARRKAEEECGFWCGVGNFVGGVVKSVNEVLQSDAFAFASIVVGAVCPMCGLVMGVASAAFTCLGGGTAKACAGAVLGAALGGVGVGLGKAAVRLQLRAGAREAAGKWIRGAFLEGFSEVTQVGASLFGAYSAAVTTGVAFHDGLKPVREGSPI